MDEELLRWKYPFCFNEFVRAMGFANELKNYSPDKPLPEIMHNRYKRLFVLRWKTSQTMGMSEFIRFMPFRRL